MPRTALLGLLTIGLSTSPAGGEPVDLQDTRPRPVRVSFELSSRSDPGRLDTLYSPEVSAWLAPGPLAGQSSIRIESDAMVRVLADYEPVPERFGAFVWTFDTESGHVVSATLNGALRQRIAWGMFSTEVETGVEIRMSTLAPAGFRPGRDHWGHVVFDHCTDLESDCTVVSPRAYERTTGYVNAVGSIDARVLGGIGTRSFSPLGEARFSESGTETAVSLGPGPRSPTH